MLMGHHRRMQERGGCLRRIVLYHVRQMKERIVKVSDEQIPGRTCLRPEYLSAAKLLTFSA